MGEPLCEECARALYGFDKKEKFPRIMKIDPYYQLWYRRQRSLPIFEAYLNSEVERYKLELKLEDAKESNYTESVDESIRHNKYKRCLAMAKYWVAVSYHCVDDKHRQRAKRHHYKWLELAEQFEEANNG